VSDINPADLTLPGRRPVPDSFDDDSEEMTTLVPIARKPEREGLPSSYRMRADAHYVDQLSTSRRSDRPAGEPARAGALDLGAAEADVSERDRNRARVMAKLTEDLATISAAATLLAGDASPMARRLNTDLIRAEAWRGAWLVRAQAILDGGHRGQARPRQLGSLLERIRQGFASECRLNGMTLHVNTSDWNTAVTVAESELVAGITGAVVATIGLIGRSEGAAVTLTAEATTGELRTIEVAQDEVSVPTSATLRFFDAGWAERPGGWLAGIGAATARAVAQLSGGTAALLVGERRGTVVRLTLGRGF
jgi:hypothetical protein